MALQILIQGFVLSGLYALLAVGFTMIFSVGRVLNLAYGVYIMLGGYIYFITAQEAGLPVFASFIFAMMSGIVFGLLTYEILVRRLEDNPIAVEIATLILAVVMQTLIVMIFSPAPKSMWPVLRGVIHFEGFSVTMNILLAMAVSWVVLGGLFAFVRFTHIGRAIRAVSMDRKGAVISGIDPRNISRLIWGLSGALGAIAGVFFATFTQLDPHMWVFPLIIAVAVVIVGGIGSIIGSLIAAQIIGFLETITTTLIAAELRGVSTMALIIIVLLVRPKGLFVKAEL